MDVNSAADPVPAPLDEQDLRLIHALQIHPRITWAEAAAVLGTTPATLSARWERLRADGAAWISAYPNPSRAGVLVAFVEVDCLPDARDHVVRALCADTRAVTIEESARGRDLLLTVIVPDLAALTAFVHDDLPRIEGTQRFRTFLATEVHWHGDSWQLDALGTAERTALHTAARRGRVENAELAPEHGPIVTELIRDGRATAADIARATDRSPATVRRQLARLLSGDALSFRCEVAQVQSRWPYSCTLLARVPAPEHERTVRALRTLPELRLCVSTTGETNLMLSVWLRGLRDLLRIERLLGERLPWLNLVETAVTLRSAKRMGRLLRPDGRTTGEVVAPDAALYMR